MIPEGTYSSIKGDTFEDLRITDEAVDIFVNKWKVGNDNRVAKIIVIPIDRHKGNSAIGIKLSPWLTQCDNCNEEPRSRNRVQEWNESERHRGYGVLYYSRIMLRYDI